MANHTRYHKNRPSGLKYKLQTHGHCRSDRRSTTYVSWQNMIKRCTDPKHRSYAKYAGAGITVCARWRNFDAFLADMGERPDGLTLDRYPNREGNYEPGNCRWATPKEQVRNRAKTIIVDLDGERMPLAEAVERLGGQPYALVVQRYLKGWDVRRACTEPPQRKK